MRTWLLMTALAALFTLATIPAISATTNIQEALQLNKEGEHLLEQGKFVEAADVFTNMLEKCGNHRFCTGVAKFYLGRTHLEIAQYEQAMGFLNEAETIFEQLGKKNEKAMVAANKGKIYTGKGEYQAALKCFKEAEEMYAATNNTKELLPLYNSMAVVEAYLSHYDEAFAYLNKAGRLADGTEDARSIAPYHNNFGLFLAKKDEYKEALDHFTKALASYESSGDLKGMSVVHNNIGHVYESKCQYKEALEQHELALKLARQIHDPWSESLALNNLGSVELKRGNYKAAQDAYEKSLAIRNKLGIKHFAAETLNNMGLVWLAYANYPKASECFAEASDICRSVGSQSGEAWALHNRAFLFKDQGQFKAALASSEEALGIARKIGDRRLEATAMLRLGNLYEYQGLFDKALDDYVKAADIQKEISDWNFRSNTLADVANIMVRQGDTGDAEDVFQEALRLKRKIGAPFGELLCKLSLVYLEKPTYEKRSGDEKQDSGATRETDMGKAQAVLAQATDAIKPEQKLDLMLLTYARARYLLAKDPRESIKPFNELKSMAEKSGIRKYSFLASVGLGLAYEALDQWEDAAREFREAIEYAENIRKTLDPYERLTFLDGEEILGVKHVVPYEGLSRVLMKKGEGNDSLMWSEYTKARAFSEAVAQKWDDASHNVSRSLLAEDRRLDEKLTAMMRALDKAYEQGSMDAVHWIREEIGTLTAQRARHVEKLRQEFPLYAATRYPEPVGLKHAALKPDEWALAYDVTDSGVLIYLTRGKTLVKGMFKAIPRPRLDALVRTFREPMEIVPGRDDPVEKLKSFDLTSGKKLADILLGDIVTDLPQGAALIVVPDDSLGTLPFEMLVLNDTGKISEEGDFPEVVGAEFFGNRNPVSYYQSLTGLSLIRTLGNKNKPSDKVLVMADPVFQQRDPRAMEAPPIMVAQEEKQFSITVMNAIEETMGNVQFNRLPMTGELAENLESSFQGHTEVYTGFKASKKSFVNDLGPELASYGKVVFGTHGFFCKDSPHFREPILVFTLVPLGTDGFLRMSEVTGLKLNCDVVALTACQTGLGRHISGEGTMGMGRAFQYAGARSVLTSLWSVSESSSVKLMESFFKHVKEGKGKLESLQLARAELREEGYNHPFFWAAFILVGEVN